MTSLRRERLLILGDGPLPRAVRREVRARPAARFEIAAVLAEDGAPSVAPRRPGPVDDLQRVVAEQRIDRIVVGLREPRGRPLSGLVECRMAGVAVERAEEFYERLTGRVPLHSLTPAGVMFWDRPTAIRVHELAARALGLTTAIAGLALGSWLFAVIAALIKLDSPGPVLFVQERIGRFGRPFRLIKFRTMCPDDRRSSEWEKDNGHRITRLGAWLRRFHLDELPQFINVLRGEMDLVGPRPHPVANLLMLATVSRNLPECGDAIPFYSMRTMVRPGMTGWAQVRYGYANDLAEEMEKLTYDLYYVKHRSVGLDLRILVETLATVVRGRRRVMGKPRIPAVRESPIPDPVPRC
jgi:lipopolysaccharide/colanic/teichoic acid biosynthesis glycosyltransferase